MTRYIPPGKTVPVVHTYGTFKSRDAAKYCKARILRQTEIRDGASFEVRTCKLLS